MNWIRQIAIFGLFLFCSTLLSLYAGGPLPYSPAPNDPYWDQQWYLENIDTNAVRLGYDINARGAWPLSRGRGVTIAIVDDGVDLSHPDLTNQANAALHWNFETDTPSGEHPSDAQAHGTAVAGLAIAEANNGRGIAGVAPEAKFASWVIYHADPVVGNIVSQSQLAKMFQFHLNDVDVQNHSWVLPTGKRLAFMTPAEDAAISNAVTFGRAGKGVVMVRAAGNDRAIGRNANEHAYTADPRVITVAGLLPDGSVSQSSTPGAPVLVSAPGGDFGVAYLFTTDRVGTKGYDAITFPGSDLSDYAFGIYGFSGTSAATPLISGTVALMLSANPDLTWRDVQQILLLAAFQADPSDVDLSTNGAGFAVSHNTGFGLVNAGTATDLALHWSNRPPQERYTNLIARASAIPDAGLRIHVSGATPVPAELQSIISLPSLGVQADTPTRVLPLVYIGSVTNAVVENLTGKGALIRRGDGVDFAVKINRAADAGAEFAIVYNNTGSTELQFMGGTEHVAIPAVSISQNAGEALVALLSTNSITAQIALDSTNYEFDVSEPLICEQVQVQATFSHELRGDMRVTLVSPMGTRSVLQALDQDLSSVTNVTWTFMSTHHFYETSQGRWTLSFSDEADGATGTVQNASLIISGVRIKDTDKDGLDDDWEQSHFGNLNYGPKDDPDGDGYSNAREQVMKTNPAFNDSPLALILSEWARGIVRMNWPSKSGVQYEVLGTPDLAQPFTRIATITGGFPRTAWFGKTGTAYQFFQVREKATP